MKKNRSNKMSKTEIIILLIITTLTTITNAYPSITQPLHDEVYAFIKRFVVKGIITETQPGNSLPLERHRIAQALVELYQKQKSGECKLTKIEQAHLNRFLWLFKDEIYQINQDITLPEQKQYLLSLKGEHYKIDVDPKIKQEIATNQGGNTSITSADFSLYAKLGRWVDVCETQHARILAGSEEYNPYANEIKHKLVDNSISLNSMNSYAVLTLPWLTIEGGIDDLWWGPGWHGALLISDDSAPKDMLKIKGYYGPLRFTYFTASLPSKEKRYLTGHRLEIQPFHWLNIGMSETVIRGHDYPKRYLNPFIVYTVGEDIPDTQDSNVLLSLDFDLSVIPGLELYSELLIDDLQAAAGKKMFKVWNSKLGLLSGAYLVDPLGLPDTDLRVEYAALIQYVYTHRQALTVYEQDGFPIGHWLGCDADDLWVQLKHWFTSKVSGSISYEMERHGESKLKAYDYNKLFQEQGTNEWEFLSGVTESKHSVSLGASYDLIGRYSASLKYTHFWVKNVDHQVGVNDTKDQVLLSGQYRF